MDRKIVLYKDILIADNLTYQQSLAAMDKANKSHMGTVAQFFVRAEGDGKWSLMAKADTMVRAFLAMPDDCVVVVPGG